MSEVIEGDDLERTGTELVAFDDAQLDLYLKIHKKVNAKNQETGKTYKNNILVRFDEGDVVTEEMLGTEKQVFCRIYLQNHSLTQLYSDLDKATETLDVLSNESSLVLDFLTSEDIQSRAM